MSLVPKSIENLKPYEPGRTPEQVLAQYGVPNAIKLSSNENPLGPSELALEAIRGVLKGLNRYEPGGWRLRQALAELYGVNPENVVTGSGSESILANIIRTFLCDDDEALTVENGFIGFRLMIESRGIAMRTAPYRNWAIDLEALAGAVTEKTKIIYLANPNNPTGTMFTRREFEEFYRHVPARVLIVLDEAYFEYAAQNPRYPDSMTYRYDNVITLRTFSKVYGLAGARIGYGFAHEKLIGHLHKVKLPFEPSNMAEAAGIGALQDRAHLHRTLEVNHLSMKALREGLESLGHRVAPSEANFVMVEFDGMQEAGEFVEGLARRGVIVRPLAAFGLPQCVRITSGTEEEMARCVEAVASLEAVRH